MEAFHQALIGENADLLERVRRHPFFERTLAGTIGERRFRHWLAQVYLFARSHEQVLAHLAARTPGRHRPAVLDALDRIHETTELFEEAIAGTLSDVREARMSFACHGYASFLIATVHVRSFEEALVACYGSDLAFLRSWGSGRTRDGLVHRFVEIFRREAVAEWLQQVETLIDLVHEGVTAEMDQRMREVFPVPAHYILHFLDETLESSD